MDEEVEAFIYARYEALLRYSYLLIGDRGAAEDLLQEVLVGLLRRSRRDRLEHPEAYVRRSLANAAVSRWRRQRFTTVQLRRSEVQIPDHRAENGIAEQDQMWQLIRQLPPKQRAVLVLRYYEDLSDSEICHLLDIAPGTVRSQLHKARMSLRGWLETREELQP